MKDILSLYLLALFIATGPVHAANAGLVLITQRSQKGEYSVEDIKSMYTGQMPARQVVLLEQKEGKPSRAEFYQKFLKKSPIDMKREWSIKVFSGGKAPKVVKGDEEVIEFMQNNDSALGYVSIEYWEKVKSSFTGDDDPVAIYKVP